MKFDILENVETGEPVTAPAPLETLPLVPVENYVLSADDYTVFKQLDQSKSRRWPDIPYPTQEAGESSHADPVPSSDQSQDALKTLLDTIEGRVFLDLDMLKAHGRDPIKAYKDKDKNTIFNRIKQGDLQCPSCADKHNFSSTQKLKNHYRTVHLHQTPYKCNQPDCKDKPEGFNDKAALRNHIIARHQEETSKKKLKAGEAKQVKQKVCPQCGWKTYSLGEYNRHMNEHEETFQCQHCQRVFPHKRNFNEHMSRSCPVLKGQGAYDKLETFTCEVCGKSFMHKKSLNRHEKTHVK